MSVASKIMLSGQNSLLSFQTPQSVSEGAKPSAQDQTYAWLLAWLVFIVLLAVMAQTDVGYRVVYYTLILVLLILMVTQYKAIVTTLAPIGTEIPTGPTPS